MEVISSFFAVTVAESSLVPSTAISVTSEVTPESSPSIVLSLSQVRLHFNFTKSEIDFAKSEIDFDFVCFSFLFSRADEETV